MLAGVICRIRMSSITIVVAVRSSRSRSSRRLHSLLSSLEFGILLPGRAEYGSCWKIQP